MPADGASGGRGEPDVRKMVRNPRGLLLGRGGTRLRTALLGLLGLVCFAALAQTPTGSPAPTGWFGSLQLDRYAPWLGWIVAALLWIGLAFPISKMGALRARLQRVQAEVDANVAALDRANAELRQEVQEHQDALRALEKSEARFRSVFHSATMGIYLFCIDENGRLVFEDGNPAAKRFTGLDHASYLGRPIETILPPLVGTDLPAQFRKTALEGIEFVNEPYMFGGKAFEYHAFQTAPREMAVVFQDITERRQEEQALVLTERAAAVGTLASGIAHQFNNLNVAILGYADLLLQDQGLASTRREWLEAIQQAALRARDITARLLSFAQPADSTKRPASLQRVAGDTLDMLRHSLETKGIQIEGNLRPVPSTCVNVNEIGQVILNLLINAEQALVDSTESKISVETGLDADQVFVRVSDTGCGIPVRNLDRIFTPFFTTKGEHAPNGSAQARETGTGLGLSVSDTIVRQHGGKITVESREGDGTTFTVWLPVRAEAVVPGQPAGKQARVLILEDEALSLELLRELMSEAGYTTWETDDGAAALGRIESERYDVVLVDLQMPSMNGIEFLHRLQEVPESARPEAIVVTGKGTQENLDAYADLPVFDTILKPFRTSHLIDRVAAAIEKHRRSS